MARGVYVYSADMLEKVKTYIIEHPDENRMEIAAALKIDARYVYSTAYGMGIKLPYLKSKLTQEQQEHLAFAKEHLALTVPEMALKLKTNAAQLRHLLKTNGVYSKRMKTNGNPKRVVDKKEKIFFEHDPLFWTSYKDNEI